MLLYEKYILDEKLILEAHVYAEQSKSFTSDNHDFHEGGMVNKKQKMFEGKLGEKIFKTFLLENQIVFKEDQSKYDEADLYDFILPGNITIDVKTRTKPYHLRTLELVKQFKKNPKDIYVSVRLNADQRSGQILGWFSNEDVIKINRIENHGYLDNYTIYDNELREIEELYNLHLYSNKKISKVFKMP